MNVDETVWILGAASRMPKPEPSKPPATPKPFNFTAWALGDPQPKPERPAVDRTPSLADFAKK